MLISEEDLAPTEKEIISICEDILLSRLADLADAQRECHRLSVELKNKDIEIREMRLDLIRKRPENRDWD